MLGRANKLKIKEKLAGWSVEVASYCVANLSLPQQQVLGKWCGKAMAKFMRDRRSVTLKNLSLCFPELSEADLLELVEATFIANTIGAFESTKVWWRKSAVISDRVRVEGKEHLDRALAKGKGVLLLGGHFSVLDVAAPMLAEVCDYGFMYRANDNPIVDQRIQYGREAYADVAFSKRQVKDMIKYLRKGGVVWYACDQDFGKYSDVFASFFDVQVACVSMPTKIARRTGAEVLFISQCKSEEGNYILNISEPAQAFGENEQRDAQWWNDCLEKSIMRYPEQYLWMHKRFKTRPPGEASIYKRAR